MACHAPISIRQPAGSPRIGSDAPSMLNEYFAADFHQCKPADDLSPFFEKVPETPPQPHAEAGHESRDDPDSCRWLPDGNAEKREAQAHRQGIDAGCDRKRHQHPSPCRVVGGGCILVLDRAGFPEYFAADESKQRKSNPMVIGLNILRHRLPGKLADCWHHELEKTEMEREPEQMPGRRRSR